MKKERIDYLAKLIDALEKAVIKLEKIYEQDDKKAIDAVKIYILRIQEKISEVLV